ncbi:hypothetical protein ADJ73_02470 [Arsenicicoccus sp. oral taxon 190]|nr:hypothetical protein ADJ73_02470 [Arsenicicoccus sp. oral taxon 190]
MLSGYLARFGGAMMGVSIIAMLSARRGSYGLAGAISAVGLIGMALAGPLIGRLIDRRGQRRVALPLALVSVAVLSGLLVATWRGAPAWLLVVGALGNAVMPQVGTLVRSRWAHLLAGDPRALHTANSFEQVAEESCFMLGPALGGALATMVFPEAGLLLAVTLYAVGTVGLTLQTATEPPVHEAGEHHTGRAWRAPGLLVLAVTLALTGAIFGSMDVVALAFAEEHHAKELGGVALGCFAGGSLVGALLYGAIPVTGAIARRLRWGTLAMFLLLLPVLAVDHVWTFAAVVLVAGSAIAPTLITSTMLAQRLVPPSQINEGMTIVMTGMLLGVSSGSFLGGAAVEAWGASEAFAVPVGAGAVAFGLALVFGGRVIRGEQRALERWAAPA